MPGIKVRCTTQRSSLKTVPILSRKMRGGSLDRCPTCNVIHPVKTMHLWLDDTGSCIVSDEVLQNLKRAGLALHHLEIVEGVPNPPPLTFGKNITREMVDKNNRRIRFFQRKW